MNVPQRDLLKRQKRLVALLIALAVALALTVLTFVSQATAQTWHSDCDLYDTNGNGRIDRDESQAAVSDYQAGLISRDVVFNVIDCYFDGPSPTPTPTPAASVTSTSDTHGHTHTNAKSRTAHIYADTYTSTISKEALSLS